VNKIAALKNKTDHCSIKQNWSNALNKSISLNITNWTGLRQASPLTFPYSSVLSLYYLFELSQTVSWLRQAFPKRTKPNIIIYTVGGRKRI
jgi:hypothetical protein